jgi:hypothetical protein
MHNVIVTDKISSIGIEEIKKLSKYFDSALVKFVAWLYEGYLTLSLLLREKYLANGYPPTTIGGILTFSASRRLQSHARPRTGRVNAFTENLFYA